MRRFRRWLARKIDRGLWQDGWYDGYSDGFADAESFRKLVEEGNEWYPSSDPRAFNQLAREEKLAERDYEDPFHYGAPV